MKPLLKREVNGSLKPGSCNLSHTFAPPHASSPRPAQCLLRSILVLLISRIMSRSEVLTTNASTPAPRPRAHRKPNSLPRTAPSRTYMSPPAPGYLENLPVVTLNTRRRPPGPLWLMTHPTQTRPDSPPGGLGRARHHLLPGWLRRLRRDQTGRPTKTRRNEEGRRGTKRDEECLRGAAAAWTTPPGPWLTGVVRPRPPRREARPHGDGSQPDPRREDGEYAAARPGTP